MRPFVSLCAVLSIAALTGCGGSSSTCGSPDAGATCAPGGTGTITVTVTGLPAGVDARVTLTGPSVQAATHSQTFASAGSGAWGVVAEKVTTPDPRVRTVYAATVSPSSFCLSAGGTQAVTVAYAPIPTSNKLWVTNETGGSGEFLGFGSTKLRATGTQSADVSASHAFGGAIAFDPDGNAWVLGPTTADANLVRYSAASLASSGTKTPDREINVSGPGCSPLINGLAFDASGNLYLSSPCRREVERIDAASLAASGSVTPTLFLRELQSPRGLAFDKNGNLWVADADSQKIWRYDAVHLAETGSSGYPSYKVASLASDTPGDTSLLTPDWLAFDANGNLYANDFGGNIFFRVGVADLSGSGDRTVKPQVRFTAGVTSIVEGMAFDEEGGLWCTGRQGTVVRYGPGQLNTSTTAGAPTVPETVLTSSDIGYAESVAFYPAPAALPLYAHVP